MSRAFDKAFKRVKELVADFKANETFHLSSQYSEAAVRKDYLDEFFIALGWDVNHNTQRNPYEQEVKIERNESGSSRKADYAFFLAPNFRKVQFFVEAKRPENGFSPDDYFQTVRYGWGNTPISALTNFRQFHVMDCRFKPHINDCHTRVIKYFELDDYTNEDKFAQIYWLFSREAVADNSIAKRAAELPRPTSTIFRRELYKTADQPPDESFLIELDAYRERLAKAFKEKNPALTGEQLTEMVQRVIDRLVFIRFLEDKQIEPEFHLRRFVADGSAWGNFLSTCAHLKNKYNGVVFESHKILDAPGFQIDELPFRNICEDLSDQNSSYNFAYIPIHILGSIYERFLGKIITDNASVREKPEVRKAGGVYYTPEYIVRYIVENTVGKAIEGKTPEEISQMTFADIACGSGSFLIEVFETLLRYHAKFYNANPAKAKKGDCVKRNEGLHLSLKKKQEILRNNVFGVDIDRQAVEVAQLSLYLKLLEDETIGSAAEFQNEFHYTLLPPLTDNIVCGNSLIDWDISDDGKLSEEEIKKLNPMDFAQRFPKIFKLKTSGGELRETAPGDVEHNIPGGMPLHGSYGKVSYRKTKKEKPSALPQVEYEGGFDVIVGNPPWGASFKKQEKNYCDSHYVSKTGEAESYSYFLERAFRLIKSCGYFGYITPNTWLAVLRSKEIREYLLSVANFCELCQLSKYIFKDAPDIVPSLVFLQKPRLKENNCRVRTSNLIKITESNFKTAFKTKGINQQIWTKTSGATINLELDADVLVVIEKCKANSIPLKTISKVLYGIKTSDNEKYLSKEKTSKHTVKALKTAELSRYGLQWKHFYLWWNSKLAGYRSSNVEVPKIVIQYIRKISLPRRIIAAFDESGEYYPLNNYSYITSDSKKPSLKFILGVLNSSLLNFYYANTFIDYNIKPTYLQSLPIHKIDLSDKADKSRHDKLVSLVEKMIEAKKQSSAALMDSDKDFYKNQCDALDRQIDALVYELYGLTPEEIKIVEGENKIPVGQPLSEPSK